MSERFFHDGALSPGDEVLLSGPEAHHLAHVMRARPGDAVTLFNGDGRDYRAEVVAADRKRVSLAVRDAAVSASELPFELVAAVALPRGDRADFLVEKLTELGVTRIVPLLTERGVVRAGEHKAAKLRGRVVEASKQCGRSVLADVAVPVEWVEFCAAPGLPPVRLLAHPGAPALGRGAAGAAAFAVGPEGGFTDAEVDAATRAGWRAVGLGPRVLRVETAAVALAALLSCG